jgi:hypothetical protein
MQEQTEHFARVGTNSKLSKLFAQLTEQMQAELGPTQD